MLLAACVLLSGTASAQAQIQQFVAEIPRAIAAQEVPGLAIAVVKDDAVVYARGFGLRDIRRSDAVDEHTLFAVGSTTKAFTAAAAGTGTCSRTVSAGDFRRRPAATPSR